MKVHRSPVARLGAVAVAAVVLACALNARGGDGYPHHVHVTLPDVTNVVAGQEVRIAGRPVGEIEDVAAVDGGRAARLELGLTDGAWPLTSRSRMQLRWGGTISYSSRFIALTPGPPGASPLREDGSFPASRFRVPMEVDTVVDTFDRRTRAGVRAMLDNTGPAMLAAAPPLRRALRSAPPALHEASAALEDLNTGDRLLGALITSTDGVVADAQRADPDLARLVAALADTLSATGVQAGKVTRTLAGLPPTLTRTRVTLRHADTTLTLADRLTTRLAPGVAAIRRAAHPLNTTVGRLRAVGPDAVSTLSSLRSATPKLDPLLRLLDQRMPQIGSIASGLTEQLKCIRPYTPDIVGFASVWADWGSHTDGDNNYDRINPEVPLPFVTNIETKSPGQLVREMPNVRYAFPRPPGYNAGQPWFLPECGAGRDALDPSKDPEYKNRRRAAGGTAAAVTEEK